MLRVKIHSFLLHVWAIITPHVTKEVSTSLQYLAKPQSMSHISSKLTKVMKTHKHSKQDAVLQVQYHAKQ